MPVITETHPSVNSIATLTKVTFADGSQFAEINFGTESYVVVSSPEGVVPTPDAGRYPFSERVAKVALDNFDKTGSLA